MTDSSLTFTPAWRIRDMILAREVSSVEVTEHFLRRIESLNPQLNAYLTVSGERAVAEAQQADDAVARGGDCGPLHGVPIGVKDLTETAGIRTTNGSVFYRDYVPETDELTAVRLRASGAHFLGKTNTPEFGHAPTTENMLGDACRNPWDTARTPGGSSGGTASGLAAGLHPLATGSDGGGSIRIPASLSGIYGIKPTQGRVARPYYPPGGWRAFSQNGPMANNVRDAAVLLNVMAGPDESDPPGLPGPTPDFTEGLDQGVRGLRIGWSGNLGSLPVDPEVAQATRQAVSVFEELGATVEEAAVEMDHEVSLATFKRVWMSDLVANYGRYFDRRSEMTPTLRAQLEEAAEWSAAELALALRELEWHRARMKALVGRYDLLATPATATAAFLIGQNPTVIEGKAVTAFWGFTPFSYPFNMSGHPGASIPCGFTSDGLPIGLQIVGQHQDEATVLRASAAFEEARPWSHRRPAMAGG